MPRRHRDDDWMDEVDADLRDGEDADTVPCPYCERSIYEEAIRCPYCQNYLSQEDAGRPAQTKPAWIVVGTILLVVVMAMWVLVMAMWVLWG